MKFRGPEALNDTYKKQAGWGVPCGVPWPFLVAPPYRYVAPAYLLCLPLLRKLPGVYPKLPFWKGAYSRAYSPVYSRPPNVQPSNLQTILSSHCSQRPLVQQLASARIHYDPGKQLRSPRCLRLRERTSGTVQHRSRSQTPVRSEL
jgi:hypothetical protein